MNNLPRVQKMNEQHSLDDKSFSLDDSQRISTYSFAEKCLKQIPQNYEEHRISIKLNNDKPNNLQNNHLKKPRRIYKPKSKRVGLTKIRMEDCLRCDACSCIYIDSADYYKHMRNFHKKYNTLIPRTRKRATHCNEMKKVEPIIKDLKNSLIKEKQAENSEIISHHLLGKNIRESIKIRWREIISEILPPQFVKIKEEPIDENDMSLLLNNVEVNIKTEPPDF